MTWTGGKEKNFKVCEYKLMNDLWKKFYEDADLLESINNQSLSANRKISQLFKPDFTAVKHEIVFTENCSEEKLFRSFSSKQTEPTTDTPSLNSFEKIAEDEWKIEVQMGILTAVPINESFFQSNSQTTYRLAPRSGYKMPSWVKIDAESKQLIVLAFSTDFDMTINYKGKWCGFLVATSESSKVKALRVVITATKNNEYYESKYNYRVEISFTHKQSNVSTFC